MIDNINILISRGTSNIYKILIDPNNNSCYINQKKYEISNKLINKILDIIVTWKYEYGYSNTLDAEEFTVIINSAKVVAYHGKGIFPENYNELLSIIGGIEHGR
jgi:hypothetical protein